MSYKDSISKAQRNDWDFNPQSAADRKIKHLVDTVHDNIRTSSAPIEQAMADMLIEHYTVQPFSSGYAIEFVNCNDETRLIAIPTSATLQQIKDAIKVHHPIQTQRRPRPEDTATPEAMAKLRAMVQTDAKTTPVSLSNILARIERIERQLGL